MKMVVTGGAGFIGSNLVELLKAIAFKALPNWTKIMKIRKLLLMIVTFFENILLRW